MTRRPTTLWRRLRRAVLARDNRWCTARPKCTSTAVDRAQPDDRAQRKPKPATTDVTQLRW